MKMTKKKVTVLVICLIVFAIVIGFIAYRNRTISGDYLSEMLKDNGITRITITDKEHVVVELQSEQFNEIYDLFANSKLQKIYSDSYIISNQKSFLIECYSVKGYLYADFDFIGDVVNVWIGGEKMSNI